MDDYMGKPYKVETLEGLLRRWLGASLAAHDDSSTSEAHAIMEETVEKENPEVKREFLHDLRNALGGVIGGLELAQMYPNDPEQREKHLTNAFKAAHQAVAMTSKMA